MINFARRNILVFFRDKMAVFFSLLAVLIIIGLYTLFLGDVWTSSLPGVGNAGVLMNSWIMAGILAVTSLTTTMGAFGIMVEDRAKKMDKDFYTAPISRSHIAGGYMISALLIGLIMSFVALVIAQVYILLRGGALLTPLALLKTAGIIVLVSLTNTAMVTFLVSFFKSMNAFSTASSIVGTMIGFLTGIYLPIGSLPEAVQYVIKIFPVSHAAVLLRQIFMEQPMAEGFAGAPLDEVERFQETMGVTFRFGDTVVTPLISVAVLLLAAAVFYALSAWRLRKKKTL